MSIIINKVWCWGEAAMRSSLRSVYVLEVKEDKELAKI